MLLSCLSLYSGGKQEAARAPLFLRYGGLGTELVNNLSRMYLLFITADVPTYCL